MGIVDRLRTEDVTIDALPPPPTVRSVLERFGRKFVTDSIIPFALFLGLNSWVGLGWAMVAGTIWSIGLIVVRRRRGLPSFAGVGLRRWQSHEHGRLDS